ncbi:VPS10 domain-containing protein [Aquiflexum sp.]|uniref:VPS10 domain-containing protein n=1 Tax=Aquiflexum sp. TaxID=1872584 RepID=UPI0035938E26
MLKKLNFNFFLICIFLFVSNSNAQENITLKGNELFGSLSARQIGPAVMSGRISDITGHPTNNRVIYAGAAGGGVWKSNNGGTTFKSIFDNHNQSIGIIEVDPSNPDNVVWVGTGETWARNSVSFGDGLYKTTDGGSTWNKVGFENSDRISGIAINPNNSDELYVGVLGALWGDSEERGVYKTSDGGQTWTNVLAGMKDSGCSDLFMDPKDPNTLYAAFWQVRRTAYSFSSGGPNSALYKTTDGGKSWDKIHNGFPSGDLGRIAITVAPSDPSILYSVIESKEKKGLYRSEDAGKSWAFMNGDFELTVRPFYFSRIVVDPKNPDVVVKAGLYGSISRDGGKTFKNLGSMHADIHDIWFDIKDSDRFYVATDGGLYRTWDGGNTMEMVESLPVSQFYHVSVDNDEPYKIYGGLQDNGSWFGPSSSPGGIEPGDWRSVGAGDGFRVYRHPTKKIVYSEMQGADNIWRYDVEKNVIKNIRPFPNQDEPKYRFNWNTPIQISPHHPDRIYVGSQFLLRSNDMGNNWERISPDLTTNDLSKQNQSASGGISTDNSGAENHTTIFTIAESPLDENIIWVGTDDGNVQVTQDGGKNWTNVVANIPDLPKNTWTYHIQPGNFGKGTAYAVFEGHAQNDYKPYAYKTIDFGKTWSSIISEDVHGFARHILEDLENENLLFLGTELGLFVSIDGGQNWSKFANNMPAASVHYMAMHPKTNDLVLATHGRGVIIIDDISPLRQIKPEMLNEEVYFLKSPPIVMWEESNFGGSSQAITFVGPNPDRSAKIIYYLKKRHTFGAMSLEILDQEGNKVISLDPGKQKGINIVRWSFTGKAPKVAKGKTFAIGGSGAPRVPAGTYKVVMKKGKEQYESTIELVYDQRSEIPLESRKAQEKLTRELSDMTQDLAYLVYKVDSYLDYAEKIKTNDPKSNKSMTTLINELNKLKERLVITTGDNYVDTAEPELREKISKLYGLVISNFDKPSSNQEETKNTLNKTLKDSQNTFESVIAKHQKSLDKFAKNAGLESLKIDDFGTFIEK